MRRAWRVGVVLACLAGLASAARPAAGDEDEPISVCLTPDRVDRSRRHVDAEGHVIVEAAAVTRQWVGYHMLRVKFLEGDRALQGRVLRTASEWSRHCNLRFERSDDEDAEIRVSFDKKGGNYSTVGMQGLDVPHDEATMNLGELASGPAEERVRRVVLHEFGHAIGFIHEHQSPRAGIPWNYPAVYAYFRKTQGWDEEKTRLNLLERPNVSNASAYDRKSIMHYPIPRSLTLGGFEVPWNTTLSATDKAWAAVLYGAPGGAERSRPERQTHSVIALNNTGDRPFHYEVRAAQDDGGWTEGQVEPGDRQGWRAVGETEFLLRFYDPGNGPSEVPVPRTVTLPSAHVVKPAGVDPRTAEGRPFDVWLSDGRWRFGPAGAGRPPTGPTVFSQVRITNGTGVVFPYFIRSEASEAGSWQEGRLELGGSMTWYHEGRTRFHVVFDGSTAPGEQRREVVIEGGVGPAASPSDLDPSTARSARFVEANGRWDLLPEESLVPAPTGRRYAAMTLTNPTGARLLFRIGPEGGRDDAWMDGWLVPGESDVFYWPYDGTTSYGILFDHSFEDGFQPRRYRLEARVVRADRPESIRRADGTPYHFVIDASEDIDLKRR